MIDMDQRSAYREQCRRHRAERKEGWRREIRATKDAAAVFRRVLKERIDPRGYYLPRHAPLLSGRGDEVLEDLWEVAAELGMLATLLAVWGRLERQWETYGSLD